MNILHLHTELNIVCGITTSIFLITKNLPQEHRQSVITSGGDNIKKFIDAGIDVSIVNYGKKSLNAFIRTAFYVLSYCRKNNVDVIHSHHRYFDLIAYIVSKTVKIKTVTSVQSRVYGKKIFSYKAEKLIAVSESLKKHLKDYFGIDEKRIVLLNNFIENKMISPIEDRKALRTKLNIGENTFVIGFAGRFSYREKGVDLLLKAFGKFNEKYKNSRLLLVGGGEDEEKIKEHIFKNNVQATIIYSTQDFLDYIILMDLLVLPSRVDPFPLIMLEAGAMGIPFLGSAVDGIAELFRDGENGFLFEKDNVIELTDKMEYVMNNYGIAKQLAEKLKIQISEYYTVKYAMPKLDGIYKSLYRK